MQYGHDDMFFVPLQIADPGGAMQNDILDYFSLLILTLKIQLPVSLFVNNTCEEKNLH